LSNYFKLTFQLVHYHSYSLTEIENWIPWEREVYVAQVRAYVEKENARREQEESNAQTYY
jgi:hypothetical protein